MVNDDMVKSDSNMIYWKPLKDLYFVVGCFSGEGVTKGTGQMNPSNSI